MIISEETEDLEVISDYSEDIFDVEYAVETAREIIVELNNNEFTICDFDSNHWYIFKELEQEGCNFYFDANKFKNSFIKKSDLHFEEYLTAIKCWVANLLSMYTPGTAQNALNNLIDFSNLSNAFENHESTIIQVENFLDDKLKLEDEQEYLYRICCNTLNFLDYYPNIDYENAFKIMLLNIKSQINTDITLFRKVRILPKPKDIVIFSKVVEDYFTNLEIGTAEYFRYFAIYLWWNLTNLIPLRPSEFCLIARDSLTIINGEFMLRLPRSHNKGRRWNRNKIQIIDTILINKKLGEDIQNYIKGTEKFGETLTLISYNAIKWSTKNMPGKNGGINKIDETRLNLNIFSYHLNHFHTEIVENKYGVTIRPYLKNDNFDILSDNKYLMSRRIRPGDTRHFAFLNLMRLGFHPVEIARLGGHLEIESQFHYHQHSDFIKDVEIIKLFSKFRYEKNLFNNGNTIIGPSVIDENFGLDSTILKKFVFSPIKKDIDTKRELELGYCIDPEQRCRVDDCLLCEDWRISVEEYNSNKSLIQKKIELSYNNIILILNTLKKLHEYVIKNSGQMDVNQYNLEFNRDLITLSKKFDNSVSEFLEYYLINERKIDEGY